MLLVFHLKILSKLQETDVAANSHLMGGSNHICHLYHGHSVLLFNKSGRKWELKLWIKKRPGSAGLIVIMEKIVIHFGEDCIPFFCFDQPFGMNGILTHIAVYDIK